MSRNIAPFGLRMPEEMKKYLEQYAKASGRSLNAELVHRLERSINEDDFLLRQENMERAVCDLPPLDSPIDLIGYTPLAQRMPPDPSPSPPDDVWISSADILPTVDDWLVDIDKKIDFLIKKIEEMRGKEK